MKTWRSETVKRTYFAAFLAVIMIGLMRMPTMAAQEVTIPEGVYRIKAANGNSNGQYLFYSENSDRDKRLQFESIIKYYDPASLRDNEMEQLWMIQRASNSNSYYIWTYFGYYQGYAAIKNLIKVRKPNGDTAVYCETGADNGPDYYTSFKFYRESGSDNYNNLTIRPAGFESYRLNRHKLVRVLSSDLIYLNANKDNDTNNKLWQLEPIKLEVRYWDNHGKWCHGDSIVLDGRWNITTYIPSLGENEEFFGWYFDNNSKILYQPGQEMSATRDPYGVDLYADIRTVTTADTKVETPSLSAKKKRKITIDWTEFLGKMKKKSFWKKAKYIEIQYSTDKKFRKIDGIKKILKKTARKKNATTTLSNLKRRTKYYVRVRLWDGGIVFSKWSKTVKIKTK